MSKSSRSAMTTVLVVSALLMSHAMLQAGLPQTDQAKINKEVAGTYEFQAPDQTVVLEFYIEDGTLYGKQEGDEEIVEIIPVEGTPYAFEATSEDGQFFEMLFKKGDDGKISICVVTTQGMELEGARIK